MASLTDAPRLPSEAAEAAASETATSVPKTLEGPRALNAVRGWELALVTLLVFAVFLPFLGTYSLWDPWETHYGEVARRMLQDHDWVVTRWQDEVFRSKPVLTFWLMAASMSILGVGKNGGFGGEFVSSHMTEWAVRLPFTLFGIAGLIFFWYVVARLVSRRAAWLALLVCSTSPYYFFVTRQAITDMPMCAMTIGALGLFALTIHDPDSPLWRWRRWPKLSAYHLVMAGFVLVALPQLVYFVAYLKGSRFVFAPGKGLPAPVVLAFFFVPFLGAIAWTWRTTKRQSDVWMYAFYILMGISVLAKGPVAPGICGLTILVYLVLSGEWALLKKCKIPQGILIALAIALPWHFAMYARDGMAWYNEYIGQHILGRAARGVHGDRGDFNYFVSQLGLGMWPWIALVPAALARFAMQGRPRTRDERVRLLFFVWAAVGFFFFSFIQTKFHHYILPAVPGIAALVAFWLDDLLDGKVERPLPFLAIALVILSLVAADFVKNHDKFVELYIYRYDRPWPSGEPWNVDFSKPLAALALFIGLALVALSVARVRRWATWGLGVGALAFGVFTVHVLMVAASPHWGQRALHEQYYAKRKIHGIDFKYEGQAEFARDFSGSGDMEVRALLPGNLHVGDPMTVTFEVDGTKGELHGQVARTEENRFFIALPASERQRIAPLVAKAQAANASPRPRWLSLNADRLIAWQLNWRGENFYSGGEIYQDHFEDARTVFKQTDNKAFLEYLNDPARRGKGRKFFIVTEKGRVENLRSVLPTEKARATMQVEDDSSNKFGLVSFTLDDDTTPAPSTPPLELR